MLFVDSNLWCYYFDDRTREHQAVAKYMDEIAKAESLAVNTIVLIETAHFLVRSLGPIQGKEKIEKFISFPFTVVDFDYGGFLDAVEFLSAHSHHGIGGRDATILASMKRLGITKLATHDRAFRKVSGIEVVDPVH